MPGGRTELREDGGIGFYTADPDDLERVVSVPQAFDNQWMGEGLLREVLDRSGRLSNEKLERKRAPYVRREYLRALVNTGQVIVNRAYLYNNPAIYRDYAKRGQAREDFKRLLNAKVIIPYLYAESSPASKPDFTMRDQGWAGWLEVLKESTPTCLRLSWDSDDDNATQARRLLTLPFGRFVKTLDDIETPLLADELGLPDEAIPALAARQREVAVWARRRSEDGKPVHREDVYSKFIVSDGSKAAERRYDPAKPFAAAIKQIIDLRYNANLPDALGSYLLTPEDSLRRRTLQEWTDIRPGAYSDATELAHLVRNLRFDQINEVTGALASFEQLTLGSILELRSTPAWARYPAVLGRFLAQPTLATFGDPEHGAEAVALAYREVVREAGSIAASSSKAVIEQRWDPVIEIMVEFAGAALSIFYNTPGGGKAFHKASGVMSGVGKKAAKAAFHLVIGRATRSRGRSRVDNSLRVLDTKLWHGEEDWDEFLAALGKEGFREIGQIPGGRTRAAMEKAGT